MLQRIVIVAILSLSSGSAAAQVVSGDGLFTATGGYGFGTSSATGDDVDGGSVTFGFEKLGRSRPLSFVWSFGYSSLSSEEQQANQVIKRSTSTWPFYFGGKYWIGQGKVQGYAGAALGVYFSTLSTTVIETSETYASVQTSGLGLGVPLGLSVALSEKVLLVGGVALNWMWGNEFFDNDMLYSVNVGLAFRTGG